MKPTTIKITKTAKDILSASLTKKNYLGRVTDTCRF